MFKCGCRESQEENKRLREENEALKVRLNAFEANARKKNIFADLMTPPTEPSKKILGRFNIA